MTAETETSPCCAARFRRRDADTEAVRWDGTPGVRALLAEWGAQPEEALPAPHGEEREGMIWVRRASDGQHILLPPGDWAARVPGLLGIRRWKAGEFEAEHEPAPPAGMEPSGGELYALELLAGRLREDLAVKEARLEAVAARCREAMDGEARKPSGRAEDARVNAAAVLALAVTCGRCEHGLVDTDGCNCGGGLDGYGHEPLCRVEPCPDGCWERLHPPVPACAACGKQRVAVPQAGPFGRFCEACIGRCRESADFAHRCKVCDQPEEVTAGAR